MKNYYDEKTFITHYEIKKDNIIIYLGDNKRKIVKNTKENLIKILEQMKKQLSEVRQSDLYLNAIHYGDKALLVGLPLVLILLIITGCTMFSDMPLLLGITSTLSAGSIFYETYLIKNSIKYAKKNEDYEKNKFFMENEIEINDLLNNKEKNIGLKKINKVIKEKKMFEPHSLTLNDMDKLDKEDIETLIDNVTYDTLIKKLELKK